MNQPRAHSWGRLVRKKNENIHSFILDQDRKKTGELVAKENLVKAWLQTSNEIIVPPPPNSFDKHKKSPAKVKSPSSKSTRAFETHGSYLEESLHAVIENGVVEVSEARILEPRNGRHQNLKIQLAIPTVVIACSLVSVGLLFKLDAIVNQTLYSFGLQFSYDWATPYWIAIRTTLGMLFLMIIAATLFQVYTLRYVHRSEGKTGPWKMFSLPDGSIAKMKTTLTSIKRLKDHHSAGKQVYLIETDSIVEIGEKPAMSGSFPNEPTESF